jgi:hypothetical protein
VLFNLRVNVVFDLMLCSVPSISKPCLSLIVATIGGYFNKSNCYINNIRVVKTSVQMIELGAKADVQISTSKE